MLTSLYIEVIIKASEIKYKNMLLNCYFIYNYSYKSFKSITLLT